jgi:hypothetical protein
LIEALKEYIPKLEEEEKFLNALKQYEILAKLDDRDRSYQTFTENLNNYYTNCLNNVEKRFDRTQQDREISSKELDRLKTKITDAEPQVITSAEIIKDSEISQQLYSFVAGERMKKLIMTLPINPFIRSSFHPENTIVAPSKASRLFSPLIAEGGSLGVYGERGMGKSSMLNYISHPLTEWQEAHFHNYIFVVFNCQDTVISPTINNFWHQTTK